MWYIENRVWIEWKRRLCERRKRDTTTRRILLIAMKVVGIKDSKWKKQTVKWREVGKKSPENFFVFRLNIHGLCVHIVCAMG